VRAVKQYAGNMQEDLLALWKIWVPSMLLNFSLMPMWGRIPWVASTSLIWTCILSTMRGGSDVPAKDAFGHVDSQTLELITRSIIGPAPKLNSTKSHLLVSVAGPDRPGIIRELASRLYKHDASISHSKMMTLGAEFSIVMHVECTPDKHAEVRNALADSLFANEGLEVNVRTVRPLGAAQRVRPAFTGTVSLTGVDQPGLLFRLCDTLSTFGLNIEHLQTEQHRTMGGASQYFTTHCHVCGDKHPELGTLRAALQKLEEDLNVKCDIQLTDSRLAASARTEYQPE